MSVAASGGRLALPSADEALPAAVVAPAPTVAVLCDPRRGQAVAAAVALALAAACGRPCGVAAAVGAGGAAALPLTAAARRGAALLAGRGYDATAIGRLVWLADLRVSRLVEAPEADPLGADPVGAVAAASLELAGAARAIGAPAALAIPLARSAALDRVLGWHDGIVVVQDGRVQTRELEPLVLDSLTALDRPVASMALSPRVQARTAALGLRAPAAAVQAVAALGLAGEAG